MAESATGVNPTPMTNENAFQRDILVTLAKLGKVKGTRIKAELESIYEVELNHGRLYPNLDTLVDRGLIEKGQFDRRTNSYELTPRGKREVRAQYQWEAECLEGSE